jgi:hypothetical protein
MAIISIPTSIGGVNIPGGASGGPLGSLYQTQGLDFLKYPRDLESATKGHVVLFAISEYQDTSLQNAQNYLTTNFNKTIGEYATGAGQSIVQGVSNAPQSASETINNMQNAASDAANYLTNTTVGQIGADVLGKIYDVGQSGYEKIQEFTTPTVTTKKRVALYMPENMVFSYSPQYDTITLAGKDGALSSLPGVGNALAGAANILEGNAAARLGLNKLGLVFNPQQQLLFKGIDFRTFQMSFTFTPYSRAEAETVKEIIKTFRAYSAPTIITEAAGMFFKPPAIFDISFNFNGAENPNIPKLKRSVVTNVEVNYAPNGWATHADGAPVQSTMTVDFQEMVLIDKKAIENGY